MCRVSDEQSNTWTAIANMLSRRSSAGVAVLDGMLYVAGGNDGTSCLNSVERFNPKTNTWEGVAPMNIRRFVLSVFGLANDPGTNGRSLIKPDAPSSSNTPTKCHI